MSTKQKRALKDIILYRLRYSSSEELRSYLDSIGILHHPKELKRDLIAKATASIQTPQDLLHVSEYTRLTSNEVMEILNLTESQLERLIRHNRLTVECYYKFDWRYLRLYRAKEVLDILLSNMLLDTPMIPEPIKKKKEVNKNG
jgi:hypothetical protein